MRVDVISRNLGSSKDLVAPEIEALVVGKIETGSSGLVHLKPRFCNLRKVRLFEIMSRHRAAIRRLSSSIIEAIMGPRNEV